MSKAAPAARKGAGTLRDFHEEERLGRAYDAQLLARLWPFMKPHARFLVAAISMILLAACLGLVRPTMAIDFPAATSNDTLSTTL